MKRKAAAALLHMTWLSIARFIGIKFLLASSDRLVWLEATQQQVAQETCSMCR